MSVDSDRPTPRSISSPPGISSRPNLGEYFREALASDDLQWERGKAWAFEQAMGAVWYYVDSNPAMSRMGQRTLHRIIIDP